MMLRIKTRKFKLCQTRKPHFSSWEFFHGCSSICSLWYKLRLVELKWWLTFRNFLTYGKRVSSQLDHLFCCSTLGKGRSLEKPGHSPDLCIYTILSVSTGFSSFDLLCMVMCESLYRQVRLSNSSNQLTLSEVDSDQGVETFKRWLGEMEEIQINLFWDWWVKQDFFSLKKESILNLYYKFANIFFHYSWCK